MARSIRVPSLAVLPSCLLGALLLVAASCGELAAATSPPVPPGGDGGSGGGACDRDGDGHAARGDCGGDDCDDFHADIHPGAPELCEGALDENCDGQVDEGCPCSSGDARPCYGPGPDDPTRGVGACTDGVQTCGLDSVWGGCQGGTTPGVEGATCDGLDQDCDGVADQALLNACGSCAPEPEERCGNGLDDDCDGVIDESEVCNVHCAGVDPVSPQPPELACCVTVTGDGRPPHPEPYGFTCVEAPGLPACASRPCLDLDGDPASACFSRCYDDNGDGAADRCVCGLNVGTPDPVGSGLCGFETPCTRLDCDDRQQQPCYSGPPRTLGNGPCRSGTHSCVLDAASGRRDWTACTGETLPGVELCGDQIDNDCDGEVDETDADGRRCPGAGGCAGSEELCGNGLDDDCNGAADDGCTPGGTSQACYTGPAATRHVGACTDGSQEAQGEFWGACLGEIHPIAESCADGIDSDCDGSGGPAQADDVGCCPPGAVEVCDGSDNDCNGLVDEGTLNACGVCPGEPCYLEEFHDPANCDPAQGRSCNGVERDPTDPDAITLGQATAQTPFIYIAVQGINQVAKIDTVTGVKLWQVPSYGTDPSRTAVPIDYSVWVGNRGFPAPDDTAYSNLVHLDIDGSFICKADIPGVVRAVAIDAYGNVWAGSYNYGRMYKVHGSRTLPGANYPDGLARCEILSPVPANPALGWLDVGINPYGAAIDGRGYLWTASTPTVKIDTANGSILATVPHEGNYGIAIDQNNDVWFGNPGGVVHRINGDGPYDDVNAYTLRTNATGVYAVTVASDGIIWGSELSANSLVRVDPANPNASQHIPMPAGFGQYPHGVAEDGAGKIWMPLMYGGYAFRFDPATFTWDVGPGGTQGFAVEPGQMNYTYSDMTGSQLRLITTREGHWIQNFDSGYPSPDWFEVTWSAVTPPGSSVEVWVRSADTLAGLPGSPFSCGPFTAPPAQLSGCPALDGHRYAAVELVLRSGVDGARPSARDVRLSWARP